MFENLKRRVRESLILWILGALFLIVGIGLIVVAHGILSGHVLLSEILRDVGIALCISVFIAVLIEIGLAHQMFEKGLNAIMRQTVPPEVWDEIRQHVISQPVIRRDLHIKMNIANDNGSYISTTSLDYIIESLRGVFTHHVHHELDVHRFAAGYQEISVDNHPIDLKEAVSDDHLHAHFDVDFIRSSNNKKISVIFSERVRETDVINWWMPTATSRLCVTVTVPDTLDVRVRVHHPEDKLLHLVAPRHWAFDGVMLPGQGLEIQLTPKTSDVG